jgi:hypothetical protein
MAKQTKETIETQGAEMEQKPTRTPLISGAEFHDFDKEPNFVGTYMGTEAVREKDSADGSHKAGDVMGYNFLNADGEPVIIGNSHSIAKAIGMIKQGDTLDITFLGKGENSSGKPFNKFSIDKIG